MRDRNSFSHIGTLSPLPFNSGMLWQTENLLPRKMRDLIEERNTGEFHLNSNFQPMPCQSFYMTDKDLGETL